MELPKSWFIHSITYVTREPSIDDWEPTKETSIEVTGVRMSNQARSIEIAINQETDSSRAKCFVHPMYSSFTDFEKDQTVVFDGQEFKIKSVNPFYWPNKNKIHHWELELV